MRKHKAISFFTGCGGLDIGLEGGFQYLGRQFPENGFENVFACDINDKAKMAYDLYTGTSHFQVKSIVDLVRDHAESLPKADVVTGGFPCTDFSLAGKRKGFASFKDHLGIIRDCPPEESRGMLYFWMAKAVELIRPAVVIAENVKGILSIKGAVETIKAEFGYMMQVKTLTASDFGVPQQRERVIFIGTLWIILDCSNPLKLRLNL